MLVLDTYVFKALYPYFNSAKPGLRMALIALYWILSIAVMLFMFYAMSIFRQEKDSTGLVMKAMGLFFVFFIPKMLIAIFHLLGDLGFLGTSLVGKSSMSDFWSRRDFITKLGLGLGAVLFGGAIYGVTRGKFAWRVLKNDVALKRLPKAFDGFKIVQLSDAHLGSFANNYEPVERMVDMVNALEPDLIVFTGDLVNEHASEALGWEKVFARMQAKHGKYSILGNHDYCMYGPYSEEERQASMDMMAKIHKEMGFELMMDKHVSIDRDGDSFKLLGVQNWGKSRHFPKLGDLKQSQLGLKESDCKVLLSHDPTHFEEKVMGKEPIDLTLSGHTHGCQMGIEIPALKIKISPVQLAYKRWGGLYQEGEQYLHVNRGMGVLAFPGRIGMAPEITLLELRSQEA